MDPNSRKIKVLKSYIILILLTIFSFNEIVNFGIPGTVCIYANVGKKYVVCSSGEQLLNWCRIITPRGAKKMLSVANMGKTYVKFGAG